MIDRIPGDIRSMSHESRFHLWKKLKAAVADIEAIEKADPDPVNVRLSDYRGAEMSAVISSAQGLHAIHTAIAGGLPPLAGIDPLLRDALGPFYTSENEGGIQAGYLIWKTLKPQGYEQGPMKSLPKGCVAKSGTTAFKR